MFIKKEKINKTIYESHERFGPDITNLNTLVDTYSIEYKTPDCDETIGGYICMPKIIKTKLPVLVYIRGGASIDGRWDDIDASTFLSWVASLGYIVIMSNLRVKDELGGNEIDDIYYLEELLYKIPEADLQYINIIGHSMGAINSYRILQSSKFKNKIGKVIILAGCSDTIDMMTRRPNLKQYWSQYFDTNSDLENYKRSSINWIDTISSALDNLYLMHGTVDERVDYFNFEKLKVKMNENNKKAHFVSLLNKGHNPSGFRLEIKEVLNLKG
jgi:dipeptidyl aminopeptidase/acylaminoacyl peptidase